MTIYQFFFIIILIYLVYNIKHEYNLRGVCDQIISKNLIIQSIHTKSLQLNCSWSDIYLVTYSCQANLVNMSRYMSKYSLFSDSRSTDLQVGTSLFHIHHTRRHRLHSQPYKLHRYGHCNYRSPGLCGDRYNLLWCSRQRLYLL